MKKTVCVIAVMAAMLTVFFCTPVFADTYISSANSRTYTKIVGSVGLEFRAVQLKGPSEALEMYNTSTGMNYLGNHINVVVQLKLTNYSDYPQYVRSLAPRFVFANGTDETYRRVTNIENYTDEMYFVISNSSSYFDIAPSVYFSDGSLIDIPPHSSITAIANVEMFCEIPVNSQIDQLNFGYATIDHLEIYNDTFASGQTDVYPQGTNHQIIRTMEEILAQLQSSNSTDVSTDSGTLANQSDNVHQQEASYYAQNSAAIQATGLSNYQFDASAVSGLTGVRGDFIDVWNSLGGWNSVYIFSLTLGLALTILRHSPSAISSTLRRRRQNNE